jgi:hypothetical protein
MSSYPVAVVVELRAEVAEYLNTPDEQPLRLERDPVVRITTEPAAV